MSEREANVYAVRYLDLMNLLARETEKWGGSCKSDLTPGGAAHNAARILDAALAVLLIGAAAILPLAAVVTAGWIVVTMGRRRLREQALDAS